MLIQNGESENSIELLKLLDIPVKELARAGGGGWVKSDGKSDDDDRNKFFKIFSQYIGREVAHKQHVGTIERVRDDIEGPLLRYKNMKSKEIINLVKSMSMKELDDLIYYSGRTNSTFKGLENENLKELYWMASACPSYLGGYGGYCKDYPDKFRIEKCTSDLNNFLREFGLSYLNCIKWECIVQPDYKGRIIENLKVEAFLESSIDEQYTGDMITTNLDRLQKAMNKIQNEELSQEEKGVIDILTRHIGIDLHVMLNECPKRIDMKDFDFKEYKEMINSKLESMGLLRDVYEIGKKESIAIMNERFKGQVFAAIKNRIDMREGNSENVTDEKSELKEQNESVPAALVSTLALSTASITSSDIRKISEIVNESKEMENSVSRLQSSDLNR